MGSYIHIDPDWLRSAKESGLYDTDIAEILGCSRDIVIRRRNEYGIPRLPNTHIEKLRRYGVNHSIFSVIDTEKKAYSLGFIAADGHVRSDGCTVVIELKASDADILSQIRLALECSAPLHFRTRKGNFDQVNFRISSTRVVDDLVNLHGFSNDKSSSLVYPPSIPDDMHRHFIRGLWDGDGYISERQFGLCGTLDLVSAVREIVQTNTGQTSWIGPDHGNLFRIVYPRSRATALHWIYDDASIYLQRKYDRLLRFYS